MKKGFIILDCAVLAAAAVLGSYYFRAARMRLDEPVFLTHYIESRQCSAGKTIALNYITNKDDDRSVISASFPECPELKFDIYGSDRNDRYLFHKTRNIYMQSKLEQSSALDETLLTTVHVKFSDGSEDDFDIGRILIENIPERHENVTSFRRGTGDNAGNSSETRNVLADCTLTGISSVFDENCGADISVTINGGEGSIPLSLHSGDTVTFDTTINISGPYVQNVYNIDKRLTFEDSSGNIYYDTLSNIEYTPEFSESAIRSFLKERGKVR